MQTPHRTLNNVLALCLAALICGPTLAATAQETRAEKKRRPDPKIEFTLPRSSFAVTLRELSAKTQHNVVLMNGLDLARSVGPYDSKKLTTRQWLDLVAKDAGLLVDHSPAFAFFHPTGYEVLNAGSIATRLDPALAQRRTSLHFDADTPLYAALALLSHSLDVTLVADNIVADARCGELHLRDLSLADGLDALLRSARIADRAYQVRADTTSVFLYSPARPLRQKPLIEIPGEPRPDSLDKIVTLHLPAAPEDPTHLLGYANAVPLGNCLDELSRQLDLRVEADTRMHALPVNPTVIVKLPLHQALDLIIHQWPLPHFGVRLSNDTLRFIYLGPPIEN